MREHHANSMDQNDHGVNRMPTSAEADMKADEYFTEENLKLKENELARLCRQRDDYTGNNPEKYDSCIVILRSQVEVIRYSLAMIKTITESLCTPRLHQSTPSASPAIHRLWRK